MATSIILRRHFSPSSLSLTRLISFLLTAKHQPSSSSSLITADSLANNNESKDSNSNSNSTKPSSLRVLSWSFAKLRPQTPQSAEILVEKVAILKDELIKIKDDYESVHKLLDQLALPLVSSWNDGVPFILLLKQLHHLPHLSLEVFNWRKQQLHIPMTSEEYTKGIALAGKTKNVELAVKIFNEAAEYGMKTSATYNALMAAYMVNNFPDNCQSLYREFKMEEGCHPTTVTYNILMSVFGRLMLMDHMEATLQEIYDSGLSPSVVTFNNLIAGYLTAWMWDRMENAFMIMKEQSIEPDDKTYMLLLKGYAYSGNLKKMEAIYELKRQLLNENNLHSISVMICAYCKCSSEDRVEKVDGLIKLIPEQEYTSWLTVLLINLYAEERLLEKMEKFINIAFQQKTTVVSVRVMRAIITTYYNSNSVEKLTKFVKLAEFAGWRICRSLYHCQMVMYGSQNRLEEMENVLAEMDKIYMDRTKKTWVILCKAYLTWGQSYKSEQIKGLMYKKYIMS